MEEKRVLNSTETKDIIDAIKAAVTDVEKKYSIHIVLQNVRYTEDTITGHLEIAVISKEYPSESLEETLFKRDIKKLPGFSEKDYKRQLFHSGKVFEFYAVHPNAKRNNCGIRDISNGKEYVCDITTLKIGFATKEGGVNNEDAIEIEKKEFERNIIFTRFQAEDYGKTVAVNGQDFKLVGYDRNKKKNKCTICDNRGVRYRCNEELIALQLHPLPENSKSV